MIGTEPRSGPGAVALVALLVWAGCGGEQSGARRRPPVDKPSTPSDAAAVSETRASATPTPTPTPAAGAGWGHIVGRIVWAKEELPARQELAVTKDQEHCLGPRRQPILDETYVVDPQNKGLAHVFVYLRADKSLPIHPDEAPTVAGVRAVWATEFEKLNGFGIGEGRRRLAEGQLDVKTLKSPSGAIDQLRCVYVPHALAVREGQGVLVINAEPVAHNVKVSSFSGRNDSNINMPPNSFEVHQWVKEPQPLTVECSIHQWMRMYVMVFDHPYFAVTREDGRFELRHVPAGEVSLVIRHPPANFVHATAGGRGSGKGVPVHVEPGSTLDLGEIGFSGE